MFEACELLLARPLQVGPPHGEAIAFAAKILPVYLRSRHGGGGTGVQIHSRGE